MWASKEKYSPLWKVKQCTLGNGSYWLHRVHGKLRERLFMIHYLTTSWSSGLSSSKLIFISLIQHYWDTCVLWWCSLYRVSCRWRRVVIWRYTCWFCIRATQCRWLVVVGIDLNSFLIFDPVYDLDEGVVGSNVSFVVGWLGAGVGYLRCLCGLLKDLTVVQFLLCNLWSSSARFVLFQIER